jgi:hypothetical protein
MGNYSLRTDDSKQSVGARRGVAWAAGILLVPRQAQWYATG